jgi:hypothetical protein
VSTLSSFLGYYGHFYIIPRNFKPSVKFWEQFCSFACSLRVRNKKELNAKLKGATLGDADPDVDDTLKWLKRSKKKEKELAKKRQEELENMDRAFQGADYTESEWHNRKLCAELIIICYRGFGRFESQP